MILELVIWLIFFWVIYHIFREIAQDLLKLKSPIILIGHRTHKRPLRFGQTFSDFWRLFFEIPILLSCLLFLYSSAIMFGLIAIAVFISYIIFWIYTTY